MKTAIITGVTSGIGKAASFELAKNGYTKLYLVARNKTKLEKLQSDLKEQFPKLETVIKVCDLADFNQIQQTATEIKSQTKTRGIDLILNNAGIGQQKRLENPQGFEYHLAVNYLSQVILTEPLISRLNEQAMVIFTSSFAYMGANIDFDNLNLKTGYSMFKAYANSKAMQMMYAKNLRLKYQNDPKNLHFEAIHPGVVKTHWAREESNLLFKLFLYLGSPFMISSETSVSKNLLAPTYPANKDSLNNADIWIDGKAKVVSNKFMQETQLEKLAKFTSENVEKYL